MSRLDHLKCYVLALAAEERLSLRDPDIARKVVALVRGDLVVVLREAGAAVMGASIGTAVEVIANGMGAVGREIANDVAKAFAGRRR